MTRSRLATLVFLAAFLLRLPVALRHIDTWYPFEVHSGNIAMGFLDGLRIDWPNVPIMQHIRGGVVFGFLQSLTMLVLGPTALALKLVPLLWHAATIALTAGLLDRFFSRRAAVITTLLLLFAPPLIVLVSTLGFASHLESALPMLLALWPFLAITSEGRREPRLFFFFGLACGFAGFFHLQAILPCLILAGLLVLVETRRCFGRAGLVLLLGAALGAAPSWLFVDGHVAYLQWTLRGHRGETFAGAEVAAGGASGGAATPIDMKSEATKLTQLFDGGFASIMSFPKADPSSATSENSGLGTIYTVLLLAAVGAGVWSQRKGLAGLVQRVFLFRKQPISPATLFIVHPVMVLVMSLRARANINTIQTGIGFENRRMVAMLFSLLVLAGIGLATGKRSRARMAALAAMLVICASTTLNDLLPVSKWPPMQSGALYEWFERHVDYTAQGNPEVKAKLLERIDFGDARFRTLRFRPPIPSLNVRNPRLLAEETASRAKLSRPLAVWRACGLGRALGRGLDSLAVADIVTYAQGLPELESEALLHGLGLGLYAPRSGEGAWGIKKALRRIHDLFSALPGRMGQAAAEGFGYGHGLVYDPYNVYRVPVVLRTINTLPAQHRRSFALGFGWGYRQRFGREVPAGLDGQRVLEHLPAVLHPAFELGYSAKVLPREAELFDSAAG